MGNSPFTRLRGGDQSSNFVELGGSASIYIGAKEVMKGNNGEISEEWKIVYTASKLNCFFSLTKVSAGNSMMNPYESLNIKIVDDQVQGSPRQYFSFTVRSAAAGLLITSEEQMLRNVLAVFNLDATNAWGGITHTLGHVYGSGARKGLIIREWNSRKDDAGPNMFTLRHYYANAGNGHDVGLSLAIKRIRVLDDGRFDFVVDGPHQHPAHALLYMFDQVSRTGTWNPTFCPHCTNALIQKHGISWQSESEDSDADNVPAAAPLLGSRQNAGGILANGGRFRGNNNGNLNIKYFNARRR